MCAVFIFLSLFLSSIQVSAASVHYRQSFVLAYFFSFLVLCFFFSRLDQWISHSSSTWWPATKAAVTNRTIFLSLSFLYLLENEIRLSFSVTSFLGTFSFFLFSFFSDRVVLFVSRHAWTRVSHTLKCAQKYVSSRALFKCTLIIICVACNLLQMQL